MGFIMGYDTKKRYGRPGLAALYAFTPFKLIYTRKFNDRIASYVLVLSTPKGFKGYYHLNFDEVNMMSLEEIIRGCSSTRESGFRRLEWYKRLNVRHINGYRVNIYDVFPAFEFSENKSPYVILIDRNLQEYILNKKSLEEFKKGLSSSLRRRFILAEFSFQSLSNPKICRLGLVLISHRERCPLLPVCNKECNNYYYIAPKETYGGLFKVYPHIKTTITTSQQIPQIGSTIASLHYKGYPLALLYYNDNLSLVAHYVGIVIKSKTPYTMYDYIYIPMSRYWTIGAVIHNTQSLVVTFNSKTVEKIVNELKNNPWVKFKCGCLSCGGVTHNDILEGLAIRKTIKQWNILEKALVKLVKEDESLLSKIMSKDADNELCKFMIIHTLTHVIVEALRDELGLSPEDLAYIIAKPDESKHLWNVYIFEVVSGGYGFIRSLVRNRGRLYNTISRSIDAHRDLKPSFKEYCQGFTSEDRIRMFIKSLEKHCSSYSESEKRKICNKLIKLVQSLSDTLEKYGVWFHPYTIRRVLVNGIPGKYGDEFRNVIDKMLTIFNSFDGNIGCGFLEEGCAYGPFLEPLTISFSVLEHIANNQLKYDNEIKDVVIAWLETTSNELRIMTSNMSKDNKVFRKLQDLAKKAAVRIRILLGKNAVNDEKTCKAVKELKELLGDKLEVKIHELLHSKAIIIDDVCVVTGSFNLTASGLSMNIENLEVVADPSRVHEYIARFEDLWKISSSYTC